MYLKFFGSFSPGFSFCHFLFQRDTLSPYLKSGNLRLCFLAEDLEEEEEEEAVRFSGTWVLGVRAEEEGRVWQPRAEVEEVPVRTLLGPAFTDASAGIDWLSWSVTASLICGGGTE